MKLESHQRVSLEVAVERCLSHMRKQPKKLYHASEIAGAIWPNHQMNSQGAGAAASRILKRLEKEGLVGWTCTISNWGWLLK